ncbi:MAG: hypothetical protein M1818_006394 [Claussenomyces sp. TS43310]|nr:MAG: hypothetical protein M1818_006394 [Claussenomyces sp. TS43310]
MAFDLEMDDGIIQRRRLAGDIDDHLKLTDFDNTAPIGTPLEVGIAPYARVLGDEGGEDRGTFGGLGPRTEQFAIGSIFYYLMRCYEPYDNERLGECHDTTTVDLLLQREFPCTDNSQADIIRCCWLGMFDSIKQLSTEIRLLAAVEC